MNYYNLGNLPENYPRMDYEWRYLFVALCSLDSSVSADIQNKFFDTDLPKHNDVNQNYYTRTLSCPPFKIDSTDNSVSYVTHTAEYMSDQVRKAVYDLCREYAEQVILATRKSKLTSIIPYDSRNAWMYGKGDPTLIASFESVRSALREKASWIDTAIQMNIDGCLYHGSKSEQQNQREWNVKLLLKYYGNGNKSTGRWVNAFNINATQSVPATFIDGHIYMATHLSFLSYGNPAASISEKNGKYTGYFLINP